MADEKSTLSGGGKAGGILRRVDWSATSLGNPEAWPEPLRISLRIILTTNYPMLIWWGGELVQFYNDGFAAIARNLFRTHGLGAAGKKYWREKWKIIGPDVQDVMDGKGGICRERQLMTSEIDRDLPQQYWTYSFSPIIARNNEVVGILFVCRDETKEIREKLALRAREADLARVQQIGRVGGLEVRLTSGFRNQRSPEYLMIHGLPPAAANETHENWVCRIHPEDRYRTENAFIEAVKGDSKGYSIQYRIIRPSDQRMRWISAKTEIERDRGGNAIRLIGAHFDVTDQVDLRAIERARFTAALDVMRCAVVLTDANGRIVYANRSAERMLEEGSCLRSRHNVIRAVVPAASRELSEALRLAARSDVRFRSQGLAVKLSDESNLPVVAHVLPLASTEFGGRIEPAIAAIFIRDRDDAAGNATLLATTYELTSAETRVLSRLLAGRSLTEAAKELQVATSTVRTHLDVVFRKTGVSRQSELILLASQLSAPICRS
jgi:PAS domain-containing protein/DNA-binding CsgD family transcriptional regulator